MAISTVIFDLGGVLVDYNFDAELAAVADLVSGQALEMDEYVGLKSHADLFAGRVDHDTLFQRLVERGGFIGDKESFLDALVQGFREQIQGIEAIVDGLSGKHRLAMLSNTQKVHWEHALARYPSLLGKLERHFVSYEMGLAKPDVEAFRHVTSSLGVEPGECLFVDDVPVNVEGARAAGLNAVEFTGAERLVRDLAGFGIDAGGR